MKVFIRSEANQLYVCADDSMNMKVYALGQEQQGTVTFIGKERIVNATREHAGPWETFYLEGIEYSYDELVSLAHQLKPILDAMNGGNGGGTTTDPSKVPAAVYATGNYDLTNQSG